MSAIRTLSKVNRTWCGQPISVAIDPGRDIDFNAQMRYTEVTLGVQSDRGEPDRWSEKVF